MFGQEGVEGIEIVVGDAGITVVTGGNDGDVLVIVLCPLGPVVGADDDGRAVDDAELVMHDRVAVATRGDQKDLAAAVLQTLEVELSRPDVDPVAEDRETHPQAPPGLSAQHVEQVAIGEPGDRDDDFLRRRVQSPGDLLGDVLEMGGRFHGLSVDCVPCRAVVPRGGPGLSRSDRSAGAGVSGPVRSGGECPVRVQTGVPACQAGGFRSGVQAGTARPTPDRRSDEALSGR